MKDLRQDKQRFAEAYHGGGTSAHASAWVGNTAAGGFLAKLKRLLTASYIPLTRDEEVETGNMYIKESKRQGRWDELT